MRIAYCALALALVAACGAEPTRPPAPLTGIRLPIGVAVLDHRLLVLSSNADLFYDVPDGGSLLTLDPTGDPVGLTSVVTIAGAMNVRTLGGELALARADPRFASPVPDAEACGAAIPGPLALFATRGSNTLNVLSVASDGALACVGCGMPAAVGFGDPFAVKVACGNGKARAYVGYMTTPGSQTAVTELDLSSVPTFGIRSALIPGSGPALGFAYDRDRDRLFIAPAANSSPSPLRWIDLAGCTLDAPLGAGGCTTGSATLPTLPTGVELHAIALANPGTPGNAADPVARTPRGPNDPIRAYITARLYDPAAAATAGFRNTDFGGLLIVVDLWDDGLGGVQPDVVWTVLIGHGAADVRVLPPQPGRGDVVVATSVDEGVLTVYDDDTRSVATFRLNQATGASILGHQPFGLAVDPGTFDPGIAGAVARVWVASFGDSFVTPIDVPLAAPDDPYFAGTCAPSCSGPTVIAGPTP